MARINLKPIDGSSGMYNVVAGENFRVKIREDKDGNPVYKDIHEGDVGGITDGAYFDPHGNTWIEPDSTVDGISAITGDSYISGSTVTDAVVNNSIVDNSKVLDGADIDNSYIVGSKVEGGVRVSNSSVQNSNMLNHQKTGGPMCVESATVEDSDVDHVTIQGTVITGSTVSSDENTPAVINGERIEDSELKNLTLTGDSVIKNSAIMLGEKAVFAKVSISSGRAYSSLDIHKMSNDATPDGFDATMYRDRNSGDAVICIKSRKSGETAVMSKEEYLERFGDKIDRAHFDLDSKTIESDASFGKDADHAEEPVAAYTGEETPLAETNMEEVNTEAEEDQSSADDEEVETYETDTDIDIEAEEDIPVSGVDDSDFYTESEAEDYHDEPGNMQSGVEDTEAESEEEPEEPEEPDEQEDQEEPDPQEEQDDPKEAGETAEPDSQAEPEEAAEPDKEPEKAEEKATRRVDKLKELLEKYEDWEDDSGALRHSADYDDHGNFKETGYDLNEKVRSERDTTEGFENIVTYDENGVVTSEIDIYRNRNGYISSIVESDITSLKSETTPHVYNNIPDNTQKTVFIRDNIGNVIKAERFIDSSSIAVTEVSYGKGGNVETRIDRETVNINEDELVSKEVLYNKNDEVVKATVYERHTDGRLGAQVEYDGNGIVRKKAEYDTRGNMVAMTKFKENGHLEKSTRFEYNENNQLVIKKSMDGEGYSTGKVEYAYYDNDRLKSETTYDSNGRIKSRERYSKEYWEAKTNYRAR